MRAAGSCWVHLRCWLEMQWQPPHWSRHTFYYTVAAGKSALPGWHVHLVMLPGSLELCDGLHWYLFPVLPFVLLCILSSNRKKGEESRGHACPTHHGGGSFAKTEHAADFWSDFVCQNSRPVTGSLSDVETDLSSGTRLEFCASARTNE